MTTIVENRGPTGVLFGAFAALFGLAAWRGWESSLILTALLAIGAIGCLAVLIWYYRNPAPVLTISPEEIWYGDRQQPSMRIERNASGRLVFRQTSSGLLLLLADDPHGPRLLMTGFDMREVAGACIAHGWTFAEERVS